MEGFVTDHCWRRAAPRLLLAGLVCVGSPTPAASQTTGTVAGQVTLEANGDPVHGAVVIIVGSGQFTTTEEDGSFELAEVPIGVQQVLAQREHLTAERIDVRVAAGETTVQDFELGLSPIHEEVTVTATVAGAATTFEAFNSVTTLDSFDLAKNAGGGVAEALQGEAGVAKRSFGPGSSRPIIRGFDGDRVLIMQDGVRTGDLSSQSGDHGVTLDPGGLERLEVVRGPATLLYGSSAVGGVVNAITPHDAGLVDATLSETGEPLPRIPPLQGTLSIEVPFRGPHHYPGARLGRRASRESFRARRQRDGYMVFNLSGSYIWARQHVAHILSVTGYNLTNALYLNHSSFIKELAPEIGRGIRVGYSLRFF